MGIKVGDRYVHRTTGAEYKVIINSMVGIAMEDVVTTAVFSFASKAHVLELHAPKLAADPLAGIDWSRFLPRDGDAVHPIGSPAAGDVIAYRSHDGRARGVFLVVATALSQCTCRWLAHNLFSLTNQFIWLVGDDDGTYGLVARDGKLVAKPHGGQVIQGGPGVVVSPPATVTATPRHKYGNPYLRDQHGGLCEQCGRNGVEDGTVICEPRPGWREEHENRIALITDETARFRVRVDAQPAPPPWEPSVDEWDLLPDSWH